MSNPDQLIRELRDTLDEARSYVGGPQFSPSMDSECADAVHKATVWLDSRPTEAAAMAATVPARSEQQIVDQTEALADMLMKAFHRREKADPLSTYRGTQDTRARQCWLMACETQEMLTNTDPENAAAEVDDDGAAQAPVAGQPAEPSPADLVQVPRKFIQGFGDLAHNYQLEAVPPDYYHGTEGDAFRAAYKRCGADLKKLRDLLAAPKGDSNG